MGGELRNKQCWCGSGKKYKHCHLILENNSPTPRHELESLLRKKTTRARCMAANSKLEMCSGDIISAHTISRSASLNKIAKAGHVYAIKMSFSDLDKNKGKVMPVRLGINKTSTFNGFCSSHDMSIFKPLDDPKGAVDLAFCTAAAYRAVAKELYLKEQLQHDEVDFNKIESGRSPEVQHMIRELLSLSDKGRAAAAKELENCKASLEKELGRDGGGAWIHYVVEVLGNTPPVLVSAPFQPSYLPSGEKLQEIGDISVYAENVVLNIVATQLGGAYIFSFINSEQKAGSFVRKIFDLNDEEIASYSTALAFEMSENIAISPEWWECLEKGYKNKLMASINRGIFLSENNESNPMKLLDLPMPLWKNFERKIIGAENP